MSCGIPDGEPRSFPLELSPDRLIFVRAFIDGSVDGRFILDTGAGVHVVSNSLLRRVASVPRGRFTGFRHNGERVDFDLHELSDISIAGFHQKRSLVASWSMLDSLKIDGIISLKFFEHHPFTLNLRDSVLIFETPASLTARAASAPFVPIRVSDQRGIALDVFAEFCVSDSVRLECILDTGSPGTIIDVRFAKAIKIDTASAGIVKRTRRSSFGAEEREYVVSIPDVGIVGNPGAGTRSIRGILRHHLIYDGLIGMDFLIGRRITLDMPNRRLLVDTPD